MSAHELPTLADLVDYVVRDLQTIGSLMGRRNAWQDMVTLVQENRVHGSVYVPTIEGIVFRELDRISDDMLRALWQTCDFAVPGAVQKKPDRSRMIQDLKRSTFEKVLTLAGKEPADVSRRP